MGHDRFESALLALACGFVGADAPRDEEGLRLRLRQILVHLPARELRLIRLGVGLLDAFVRLRWGRPLRRLSAKRSAVLLRGLARSPVPPLRRLHHGLQMLLQYAWFAGAEGWDAVQYDGPWLGRVAVEVLPGPTIRIEGEGAP